MTPLITQEFHPDRQQINLTLIPTQQQPRPDNKPLVLPPRKKKIVIVHFTEPICSPIPPYLWKFFRNHEISLPSKWPCQSITKKASTVFALGKKNKKGVKNWKWRDRYSSTVPANKKNKTSVTILNSPYDVYTYCFCYDRLCNKHIPQKIFHNNFIIGWNNWSWSRRFLINTD